jgi:hypothetical protein
MPLAKHVAFVTSYAQPGLEVENRVLGVLDVLIEVDSLDVLFAVVA